MQLSQPCPDISHLRVQTSTGSLAVENLHLPLPSTRPCLPSTRQLSDKAEEMNRRVVGSS